MNGDMLRQAILEDYELRPDEAAVLDAACRLADEIAAMESALDDAGTVVKGSRGQVRPHPLLNEVRQHRLALARLLKQLGIDDEESPLRDTKTHGLHAARARWEGRR